MRVESAPTPAMLAVHSPPRHTLQIFQPHVRPRVCAIDSPWVPVRPGTLNNSRLCGAEELTCGASMSNFRQSPASSCLPPCTAVVYAITTALYSVVITAPRWYAVASTPSQSTSCYITAQQGAAMVQCMRTAELPGAGHLQATLGSCAKP